jgi:hypothetical protein
MDIRHTEYTVEARCVPQVNCGPGAFQQRTYSMAQKMYIKEETQLREFEAEIGLDWIEVGWSRIM